MYYNITQGEGSSYAVQGTPQARKSGTFGQNLSEFQICKNENQYILESHLEWALCVRVQLARAEAILADVWPS